MIEKYQAAGPHCPRTAPLNEKIILNVIIFNLQLCYGLFIHTIKHEDKYESNNIQPQNLLCLMNKKTHTITSANAKLELKS